MSEPAEPNNYGVDLAISPEGDFVVNSAGALSVVGNVAVMAQALQLRLKTALGDLPLHLDYGTDLDIGGKMDPTAVAAALNGELALMVKNDPRFESAVITGVEWPAGTPDGVALAVKVKLAGGEQFEATGLPAEVRIGEVTLEGTIEGESGLTPFEEQPYFAGESESEEIAEESAIESLVNDLPTGGQ